MFVFVLLLFTCSIIKTHTDRAMMKSIINHSHGETGFSSNDSISLCPDQWGGRLLCLMTLREEMVSLCSRTTPLLCAWVCSTVLCWQDHIITNFDSKFIFLYFFWHLACLPTRFYITASSATVLKRAVILSLMLEDSGYVLCNIVTKSTFLISFCVFVYLCLLSLLWILSCVVPVGIIQYRGCSHC